MTCWVSARSRSVFGSILGSHVKPNLMSNNRSNLSTSGGSDFRHDTYSQNVGLASSQTLGKIIDHIFANIRSNLRSNIRSNIRSNLRSNIRSIIKSALKSKTRDSEPYL